MLRELHITNLAVIEDAAVEFDPGFNCFTGETGAGKSLVIGAFEMLLGLRNVSPAEVVRPGIDEARVSGVFEIADEALCRAASETLDQAIEPGEPLLVTRKLFASGRSSVSVNGKPATTAMVRALAELLVDIHGQHDHQYLLKPSNQLAILDAFGKCEPLREQFAQAYTELRELRDRQHELAASHTLRRQQLELYEFQADEIDAAGLVEGEMAELEARHRVLSNLQRIQRDAGAAYAALHEADGSVVERLEMIAHTLLTLAEIDESLTETAESIRGATLSLKEGAFELSRYVDRLEINPAEVAEVEGRLNTLNRLIAKYDAPASCDDPMQWLLAYRARIGGEIERLRSADSDMSGLDARMAALVRQLDTLGAKLTQQRKAAAARLLPLVERQLKELAMSEATFDVAFEPVGEGDHRFGATGGDRIEMLVQPNPGQPARPLRKIASGGEMSRIMLAIKSILAGSDRISVLVFDEIDANIGGRLGSVIGGKLRELAASRQQVICITHLPQIAAFAQRHLKIRKAVEGVGRSRTTRTTVTPLTGKARITELAEMMAGKGVTATTLKQAEELVAAAA
jgi:DNA repair protein RecN (Recombination protein N)